MRRRADNNRLIVYSCIPDIGNKATLFQESRPGREENPSRYCDLSVLLQIQANDLAPPGGMIRIWPKKRNLPVESDKGG